MIPLHAIPLHFFAVQSNDAFCYDLLCLNVTILLSDGRIPGGQESRVAVGGVGGASVPIRMAWGLQSGFLEWGVQRRSTPSLVSLSGADGSGDNCRYMATGRVRLAC